MQLGRARSFTTFLISTCCALFLGEAVLGSSAIAATQGSISFASNAAGALQNIGVKLVEVNRTGGSAGAATVVCKTVNNTATAGIHFTAVTQTLKWANGVSAAQYCRIPVLNSTPFLGTRTFFLELEGATGSTLGAVVKSTVSIYGDAQNSKVQLSAASFSIKQSAGSATVTVSRTGYSGGKASIGYATANGTAVAGKDYTAVRGELNWNYGDAAAKSFVIPISNSTPFSGSKTVFVAIAAPTGTSVGTATATLSIAGDAAASPPVVVTPPPVTPPPVSSSPPGLNFTAAPALSGVTMIQNRDSVIIQVPAVANARDFRVLVQPTAVAANSDGTESVQGGTQYCAGLRQHQARTRFVADPVSLFPYYFYTNSGTDDPNNEVPNFFGPPPTPWTWFDLDTPPNLSIEVSGVTANETVTVEALDRLCPFPGPIGRQHVDITLSHSSDSDHVGNPWLDVSGVKTFPVVTKDEVIAKYGSLIINGQGWAGGPNVQATPPAKGPFAQPAAPNPPKVLARATVSIAPLATPPAAPSGFFDDFSNPSDTFQSLPQPKWTYPRYSNAGELVLQNSKWTIYGNGFTCCTPTAALDGMGYADAFIDNGALHTILGDWAQGVLSEITMIPRKAAHINATNYLHVTYEVPSFATNRRYWVFTLCGSSVAGQTLDGTGALKEQVVHSTFFYLNTGMSPSTAGWNCLQVLNREGNSYAFGNWESMHNIKGGRPPVPANKGLYDINDYIYNTVASISDPTKIAAYTVHPESDVIVLINKPIPKANLPEVPGVNEQVVQSAVTSPINVSPLQLDNPAGEIAWFYKVDANGNPIAPILDDQQLVAPRTKYDLYIRNNRLIMYVNGKPTLCNDFTTPTTTLNIADAAVGFHQVLYHSLAESQERFVDPDRGGAYHYRYNSPWLDQRTWDNMGFEENVAAPSDFNDQTCFEHVSLGPENNEP